MMLWVLETTANYDSDYTGFYYYSRVDSVLKRLLSIKLMDDNSTESVGCIAL